MGEKDVVVIGLGNDIICDDRIGLDMADKVSSKFGFVLSPAQAINIGTLGEIEGYKVLIIIDSIKTGEYPVGTLRRITLDEINHSTGAYSTHQISLTDLFEIGKKMNIKLPEDVLIYSIEIKDNLTITEDLTPELSRKTDQIYKRIKEDIKKYLAECCKNIC